ncbi:MAG: response regulator [Gemmatimonadaceae bacterium]|nr:response regulator [Gemmatimonadaceae bacterium]
MIPTKATSSEFATSLAATQARATGRSLLIVDDEVTIRNALRRFFVRRGWAVVDAADGEQARALLLDGAHVGAGFDAIITDMRMPHLTGIALHQCVHERCPAVAQRFIFSSGDTGDDASTGYIRGSDCAVLQKPFDLARLLALVDAMPPVAGQPN